MKMKELDELVRAYPMTSTGLSFIAGFATGMGWEPAERTVKDAFGGDPKAALSRTALPLIRQVATDALRQMVNDVFGKRS